MEPDPIKNKKSTEYQELLAFLDYSKLYKIEMLSTIRQGGEKERRQYP